MSAEARLLADCAQNMEQEITTHRVGDATVIKIPELALDAVEAGVLYPDQANDPTAAMEEVRKLGPGSVSPRMGLLRQSIHFSSLGEHAPFWGDVMHHPLQFAKPDRNSVFCEFPEAALKSRRWAMNHAAETNSLVFTTHFAESSAGRVSRKGDRFTWHFV
jgi:hypothetical protein